MLGSAHFFVVRQGLLEMARLFVGRVQQRVDVEFRIDRVQSGLVALECFEAGQRSRHVAAFQQPASLAKWKSGHEPGKSVTLDERSIFTNRRLGSNQFLLL